MKIRKFQKKDTKEIGSLVAKTFLKNNFKIMDHKNVTTALDLPNGKILKNLGLVKGIIVRSRSILGSIGGSLQTLLGGNISLFTELCEKTREDAYNLMIKHAEELGANAIISVRYDATELMSGVTEVLCYGTAVVIE
jgi:uncharacterized protein YbjQ (UPF0145 family)